MSAVYGYDIRAVRKKARKIHPETWDNERTLPRALASIARMRGNWPEVKFVLIERSTSGQETEIPS